MLKASIFLLAPFVSIGLVAVFGVVSLAVCFGLALLALILSTEALVDGTPEMPPGTLPAPLAL